MKSPKVFIKKYYLKAIIPKTVLYNLNVYYFSYIYYSIYATKIYEQLKIMFAKTPKKKFLAYEQKIQYFHFSLCITHITLLLVKPNSVSAVLLCYVFREFLKSNLLLLNKKIEFKIVKTLRTFKKKDLIF